MNKMRRLLVTLLLVILLVVPVQVKAAVQDEIAPQYVIYCEDSDYQGRHDALANGWCEVVCTTDSSKSFSGKAFQCTKCYQVIVTENEPANGIGKYAQWNPGYKISTFSVMRVSTVKSTSSTTLAAYRFRYS